MHGGKLLLWAMVCGNVLLVPVAGFALYSRSEWKANAELVGDWLVTTTEDMKAERSRYNTLVEKYNRGIREYNEMVEKDRVKYNKLVDEYNQLQARSHDMYMDADAIIRGDVRYLKSRGYRLGDD